jgi:hypothetical protein
MSGDTCSGWYDDNAEYGCVGIWDLDDFKAA